MAKARKPAARADSKGVVQLGVRVTREYREWLEDVASYDRRTMAGLVDAAVQHYAQAIGFKKPPPERVP